MNHNIQAFPETYYTALALVFDLISKGNSIDDVATLLKDKNFVKEQKINKIIIKEAKKITKENTLVWNYLKTDIKKGFIAYFIGDEHCMTNYDEREFNDYTKKIGKDTVTFYSGVFIVDENAIYENDYNDDSY